MRTLVLVAATGLAAPAVHAGLLGYSFRAFITNLQGDPTQTFPSLTVGATVGGLLPFSDDVAGEHIPDGGSGFDVTRYEYTGSQDYNDLGHFLHFALFLTGEVEINFPDEAQPDVDELYVWAGVDVVNNPGFGEDGLFTFWHARLTPIGAQEGAEPVDVTFRLLLVGGTGFLQGHEDGLPTSFNDNLFSYGVFQLAFGDQQVVEGVVMSYGVEVIPAPAAPLALAGLGLIAGRRRRARPRR